jgi:galactokinase/mevalonate kinase-like predicted kinase
VTSTSSPTLHAVRPQGQASATVPARVGLVGNPSDGFGGAVVAAIVETWAATVTVEPIGDGLRVRHEQLGSIEWPSPRALAADVAARGHPPAQRIVTAALTALEAHGELRVPPIEVRWASTIPRSVGLAGSSAIAIAVIEAVAASVGWRLDPRVAGALALEAEVVGLGIPAGWQDRMVQASRCAVLVDTARMSTVDGCAVPAVRALPDLDVGAVIGWRPGDSEDSAAYHGELRRRADSPAVAAGMRALAELARRAAACAERADLDGLVELVDASWSTRRAAVPLHPGHEELVEGVRATGVVATSPGSGGSVVAFPRSRQSIDETVAALEAADAEVAIVRLR